MLLLLLITFLTFYSSVFTHLSPLDLFLFPPLYSSSSPRLRPTYPTPKQWTKRMGEKIHPQKNIDYGGKLCRGYGLLADTTKYNEGERENALYRFVMKKPCIWTVYTFLYFFSDAEGA